MNDITPLAASLYPQYTNGDCRGDLYDLYLPPSNTRMGDLERENKNVRGKTFTKSDIIQAQTKAKVKK